MPDVLDPAQSPPLPEQTKPSKAMADESPVQFVSFRQPKPTRARAKERRHGDYLKALTINLVDTYSSCSSEFRYTLQLAPRRVLTKLAKGVHNGGYDNADYDYICRVGDKIVSPDGAHYEILERLGHGTFGQVLKCVPPQAMGNGQSVALKIIKNKPAYFHQALVEVHILQMLNQKYDREDEKRIVRMLDFFVYRKHLCIAFELLSVNLYDVLKQNSFRGVSMALIRVLTEQLLKAMQCLREAYVIHCDLKPENVLLGNMQHTRIKLIDFGSACFENHTVYSYIQSRFYRSPEVLLGLPYTTAIDMWSLGCICAELFLGLPIFPGHSEYDQVCRIVEVQGLPPVSMLDAGKNTRKYFRRVEEVQPIASSGDGDKASGSSDSGSESEHCDRDGTLLGEPCDEDPHLEGRPPEQSPSGEKAFASGEEHHGSDVERPDECSPRPPGQVAGSSFTGSDVAGEKEESSSLGAAASSAAAAENTSAPGSAGATSFTEAPTGAAAESSDQPPSEPAAASAEEEEVRTAAADSGLGDSSVNQEQPQAENPPASGEPAMMTVPRSESLLDLLKRKVGLQPEPPPYVQPLVSAPAPPSSCGSAGGTAFSESGASHGDSAAGSAVSTAADAHERRLHPPAHPHSLASPSEGSGEARAGDSSAARPPSVHRRAPSGDEAATRDGSSDGRGEARVSGSSDGGLAPGVSRGHGGDRVRGHRVTRGRRRRVRAFWRLKTREEYERDEHKKEPIPKKYFDFKSLEQMIEHLPYKHNMSRRALAEEQERRACFHQFLWGVLQINPDDRWTPKQAAESPFIANGRYEPNWQVPDDEPVPSFTRNLHPAKSSTLTAAIGRAGVGEVPRLPADALTEAQSGFSGGGSARTWHENLHAQQGSSAGQDSDQSRSAPATTRGAPPPASARGAPSTEKKGAVPSSGQPAQEAQQQTAVPEAVLRGLWGHYCQGVPLPDDNPAESYRPPIDQLSEDFFRGIDRQQMMANNQAASQRRRQGGEQADPGVGSPGSQKLRVGARSGSTGASFCSSASSTGSTPTQGYGRGRRGITSPFSGGSPLSTSGSQRRSQPHAQHVQDQSKNVTSGRMQYPGASGTPASYGASPLPQGGSPHGSVQAAGGVTSGTPVSTTHTPQGVIPHTAITGAHARTSGACTAGSRDGSRGSSPWHLPSPMSELSTVGSDRVNSSQPSGSDSCGEHIFPLAGTQCSFDDCHFYGEDPSQSDTMRSHQPSDSDGTMTPRSLDTAGNGSSARAEEERKDPQHALWENIKSEMARVELSRDRLPRRLDITQSPGSGTAMGNFREKMGMNESGPVVPARRDANATGAGAPGYGVFSPPYRGSEGTGHQVLGGLGSSGSGGHSHGHSKRHRMKKSGGSGTPGSRPGSGSGTPGSGTL